MSIRFYSQPLRSLVSHGRCYSSAPLVGDAVSSWIERVTALPPAVSSDIADLNRAVQLHYTLPTRHGRLPPGIGSRLPEGHHLVLFQPRTEHANLGPDGTSTDLNAPDPFVRRMWAGGSFQWPCDVPALRIGDAVHQTLRIDKVEAKAGMIFVTQTREIRSEHHAAFAVRESRTHVFRKRASSSTKISKPSSTWSPPTNPSYSFNLMPTSALLFRFSALTFNGHRIHYDHNFARDFEGHPTIVVHGPLTALILIERTAAYLANQGARCLTRFDYRATSPMYIDKEITYGCAWIDEDEGTMEMWAIQDGKVAMRATASAG